MKSIICKVKQVTKEISYSLVILLLLGGTVAHSADYSSYQYQARTQSILNDIVSIRGRGITRLDTGLAGDRIDPATGLLTFYREIVTLPGNSSLPVSLGQVLIDHNGWEFDIPKISTTVLTNFGNNDPRGGQYWKTNRCSTGHNWDSYRIPAIWNKSSGFGNVQEITEIQIHPSFHASEYKLYTSGGEVSNLYRGSKDSNFYGSTDMVTRSNWKVKCLPGGDRSGGEGFQVIDPKGNTYTFDILVYERDGHPIDESNEVFYVDPERNEMGNFAHSKEKLEIARATMYASKIEDAHGNWVKYDIEVNAGKTYAVPTRIYSNDGREITIDSETTQPLGRITKVKANGREWKVSEPGNGGTKFLELPDGRQWKSLSSGGHKAKGYLHTSMKSKEFCQDEGWNSTVEHPSGAKISFWFKRISYLHASRIPITNAHLRSPCNEQRYQNSLYMQPDVGSTAYRVIRKQIVIPASINGNEDKTYTWSYQYEGMPSSQPDNVPSTRWVKITSPDNKVTKHWINRNQGSRLENKILKTEVYTSDETNYIEENAIKVDIFDYGSYSDSVALGGEVIPSHREGTYWRNFLKNKTTRIQGSDKSWDEYNTKFEYDKNTSSSSFSFDSPIKITAYSSSSPNKKKIVELSYTHKLDNNILLLRETYKKNGELYEKLIYDEFGQVTKVEEFGHLVKTFSYHVNNNFCDESSCVGNLKTVTNLIDSNTSYTYEFNNYKRGIPQRVIRPDKKYILSEIDDNGWIDKYTDAKHNSTSYSYNDLGWQKTVDLPHPFSSISTHYDFSDENFSIVETARKGKTKTIKYYNALHQLVKVDNNGIKTYFDYDVNGRIVFQSNPTTTSAFNQSYGVRTLYDTLGRVSQVKVEEGLVGGDSTTYEYKSGHQTLITDAKGFTTTNTFQRFGNYFGGNLLSTKSRSLLSPQGLVTEFLYNDQYDIESIKQSGIQLNRDTFSSFTNSNQHDYYYDDRKRLCRLSIPEVGDTLYSYNNGSQLIAYSEGQTKNSTCVLPSSGKVSLSYSNLGLLDVTNFSDKTPDISRYYDDNGNLEIITRGISSWHYQYNDLDMITVEQGQIDGLSFIIGYEYNNEAHLDSIVYPSGDKISLSPNKLGLPSNVILYGHKSATDIETLLSDIQYHPNQLLKSTKYGSGFIFKQTLNSKDIPENLVVYSDITGNSLLDLTYKYTVRSNVSSITNNLDSQQNIYNSYDSLNRLNTSFSDDWSYTYDYDPVGNLRNKYSHINNVKVDINAKNQVERALSDGVWKTYDHDIRGNVINDGSNQLDYDLANQPTSITGNSVGSFVYDGNLKRIKQVIDGTIIYSIYNKSGVLITRYNKQTSNHTDYVNIAGKNVARIESKGSLADTSTIPFARYEEDLPEIGTSTWSTKLPYPYGKSRASVKSDGDIGYTGHVTDDSGLVYMQARYYDPVIGRFYSNDPVGFKGVHSFNRYAYANNNPYKYTDPDGREVKVQWHEVIVGPYNSDKNHSLITITPDNPSHFNNFKRISPIGQLTNSNGQRYGTMGAGPNPAAAVITGSADLKSDFNRPLDAPEHSGGLTVTLPKGMSEDQFVDKLIKLDGNYQDNANYSFDPDGKSSFNSNSYVSGLLEAAGVDTSKMNVPDAPGFDKPLPKSAFKEQ